MDFLVVAAGFAAEEDSVIFEGNGDGGVLFGDDEGGVDDFGDETLGLEFAADGGEVGAEGAALAFEEMASGTEFLVEGFAPAERTAGFGGEGVMEIGGGPGLDEFTWGSGGRRRRSGGFEEGLGGLAASTVEAGEGFLGDHFEEVLEVAAADVVAVLLCPVDPAEVALDVLFLPGLTGSTEMVGVEHLVGLGMGGEELLDGFADRAGGFQVEEHLAKFAVEGGIAGRIERGEGFDEVLAGGFTRFVEPDEDKAVGPEEVELLFGGEFLEVELVEFGQDFGGVLLGGFLGHGDGTFDDGERALFLPIDVLPEV